MRLPGGSYTFGPFVPVGLISIYFPVPLGQWAYPTQTDRSRPPLLDLIVPSNGPILQFEYLSLLLLFPIATASVVAQVAFTATTVTLVRGHIFDAFNHGR